MGQNQDTPEVNINSDEDEIFTEKRSDLSSLNIQDTPKNSFDSGTNEILQNKPLDNESGKINEIPPQFSYNDPNEDNGTNFKFNLMCKENENIIDTEFNINKDISIIKTNKEINTRKGKNQKKNYYNPFNYISRWRTTVNKYFIKKINKVIQDSDLPKELKRIIHTPNFEKFTEKSKKSKVLEELDKLMKDILSLVKPGQIKAKDNEKNIKKIEDFYEENPSESVKKIITLFNKTYRETIEMFYSPDGKEYFNEFKEQNQQEDEKFKDNRGYSLFETNALIRYFEGSKKNVKIYFKFYILIALLFQFIRK
jgi:hypothetical protein